MQEVPANRSGFIHKMCGKLCENQFFDRRNFVKSERLLPVCLNCVQAVGSHLGAFDLHIRKVAENCAAEPEGVNRKCSLRKDKMQRSPMGKRTYRPRTSAAHKLEGIAAWELEREFLCRVEKIRRR